MDSVPYERSITVKVNIKDVAAAAGVAQSTVSRVMNASGYVSKTTQQKVLKAMKELGYSPSALAVSFSKSQSHIIGFIVPNVSVGYFGKLLFAADELASKNNYRMILCNSNDSAEKERSAIMDLLSYKVGGLLIVPVENSPNADLINQILSSGTPVVCIDKEMPGTQCDSIYIDNQNGAKELTKFALNKGHHDLRFLIYDDHALVTASYIRGVEMALLQEGITLPKEYIFKGTTISGCSEFIRKQYNSTLRPSAFISFSSDFTVICYRTLMALNANIPKDISLIGYDEMHMLTPFGYTISHSPSPSDMGALAVNMLLSRMEKTDSPLPIQRVLLPTNVKIETIDKKEM